MTVIEFFDKDTIKNILAVLTLKPEKTVFLYDRELKNMNFFASLEKCFKAHIPNIKLEKYPVNIMDINDVYEKTIKVIKSNENCIIELTGGSELMTVAGYKAGSEMDVDLIYTDITKSEMLYINRNNKIVKTTNLTLLDFINSKGAALIGNSKAAPEPEIYEDVINMCNVLFNKLEDWKVTCSYLQTVAASFEKEELDIKSRRVIRHKNGQMIYPDEYIMGEFQKNGFIKDLSFNKNNISFSLTSSQSRQYMINYGGWLELYVYIEAKRAKMFDDILLGAMIDWNVYDGVVSAGNEIDVILSDGSTPVFISCKLREADTDALNEIWIAKRRLGGWFSKSVVVAFGSEKAKNMGTYKRACELGISVLDKEDILSRNFGERLVGCIKAHDLIGLKWR
ncbi:MAG: DUF1887 family CARF protein [Lachnospiraceae bacterium]|nr:DUF1887 family CARF protein [Lachnospiraceae bacterium]